VIWELDRDVVYEDYLAVSARIFDHLQFPNSLELANPILGIRELNKIGNPRRSGYRSPGMNALVAPLIEEYIHFII